MILSKQQKLIKKVNDFPKNHLEQIIKFIDNFLEQDEMHRDYYLKYLIGKISNEYKEEKGLLILKQNIYYIISFIYSYQLNKDFILIFKQ